MVVDGEVERKETKRLMAFLKMPPPASRRIKCPLAGTVPRQASAFTPPAAALPCDMAPVTTRCCSVCMRQQPPLNLSDIIQTTVTANAELLGCPRPTGLIIELTIELTRYLTLGNLSTMSMRDKAECDTGKKGGQIDPNGICTEWGQWACVTKGRVIPYRLLILTHPCYTTYTDLANPPCNLLVDILRDSCSMRSS